MSFHSAHPNHMPFTTTYCPSATLCIHRSLSNLATRCADPDLFSSIQSWWIADPDLFSSIQSWWIADPDLFSSIQSWRIADPDLFSSIQSWRIADPDLFSIIQSWRLAEPKSLVLRWLRRLGNDIIYQSTKCYSKRGIIE